MSSTAPNPILILTPRALLGSLFSFEALLVLYMFAANFKASPRFAWIPFDPTGLFFALSVVVGSFIIVFNPIHKKALPVIFAMVCLVTWLMVSQTWSPSRIYGPDKVFSMATLALWSVIAGALIIAPDPERLRRLFTLLALFGIWMGVESVLAYLEGGGNVERIRNLDSGGYLTMGRIVGLGGLVALAGWMSARSRMAGWFCLALFIALGFVLAIGGGRGPLLATGLALLIPIGLSVRLTTRRIWYSRTLLAVLLVPLLTAGALALYTTVTEHRLGTIDRIESLMQGDLRGSAAARADLYRETNEMWQRAPLLGQGIGGWPVLAGYGDNRVYPHNLFAELLVEGGMVALALFLAMVGVALRSASLERMRRDPQALCAMMLLANTVLNAMVSSDLPGNRPVFMMLGVLALFAIRPVGARVPGEARRRHTIESLAPPTPAASPASQREAV